jgi:hypothetical protein
LSTVVVPFDTAEAASAREVTPMKRTTNRKQRLGADLIKGALAGAAATWVMEKVTTWMYEMASDQVRQRENAARDGKSAYVIAARKAADVGGLELSDEQQERAGTAIHWTLGIAAGAMYAVLRRRVPAVASGKGLPFGAGFFLVVDEFMIPALGFTPGPAAFPWQAHARGLGGHLAFGLASEAVLEGLDLVA